LDFRKKKKKLTIYLVSRQQVEENIMINLEELEFIYLNNN